MSGSRPAAFYNYERPVAPPGYETEEEYGAARRHRYPTSYKNVYPDCATEQDHIAYTEATRIAKVKSKAYYDQYSAEKVSFQNNMQATEKEYYNQNYLRLPPSKHGAFVAPAQDAAYAKGE